MTTLRSYSTNFNPQVNIERSLIWVGGPESLRKRYLKSMSLLDKIHSLPTYLEPMEQKNKGNYSTLN